MSLWSWRLRAHKAIDHIWIKAPFRPAMHRSVMYDEMEKMLGRRVHMSKCDVETCKEIIRIAPALKARVMTSRKLYPLAPEEKIKS